MGRVSLGAFIGKGEIEDGLTLGPPATSAHRKAGDWPAGCGKGWCPRSRKRSSEGGFLSARLCIKVEASPRDEAFLTFTRRDRQDPAQGFHVVAVGHGVLRAPYAGLSGPNT